jgi:hypothetical protein
MDHVRSAQIDALHAPGIREQTILGRHHPPLQSEKDQLLRHQRTRQEEGQRPPALIDCAQTNLPPPVVYQL